MLQSQDEAQTANSGSGAISGLAGTAVLANELGLFDDLGISEMFGSSAIGGGGTSALSGAGAMSVQPAMDTATISSLSNGGSGLMTQAPAVMQSSAATPAATTTIGANAAGMGALPLAGIALGTYLGGKSAYNLLKGKKDNSLGGKAGRVTLGIATGGLSEIARPFLAKKSTKEIQADRWKNTGREDLADMMKGWDYGNNNADFKRTRDEKYLRADDIRVNPDNYNNVADWDRWNKKQQDLFLNDLLQNGKVREKKGGIYYDDDYAQSLADKIRSGKYPIAQPQPQQKTVSRR